MILQVQTNYYPDKWDSLREEKTKMYNRQLRTYINHPATKYVVLDNGKEVKIADISSEEYEALKEWGCIIREFER